MNDLDLTAAEQDLTDRFLRSVFDNHAMNQLKRSLATRLGPQMGFAAWRRLIPPQRFPDADRLEPRPLRSLRAAAEQSSVCVDVLPPGQTFEIAPPKVIGDGDHHALRGASRSLYLTCLSESLVRSLSSVIAGNDAALLDFEGSELTDIRETVDFDQAIFAYQAENQMAWLLMPSEARHALDEAFSLLGWTSVVFGHWLHEYLARYVMATMTGSLPPVPILINEGMPKSHRQALELLVPENVEIIMCPGLTTTHVRRLWVSSCPTYPAMFPREGTNKSWDLVANDPVFYATILKEMARRFGQAAPPGRGPDKVYLSRKMHRRRKLINAAEIEEIAQAAGFTIVYPEDLAFAEQFRLVRDASFILGPEGSGMGLSCFGRPGTRVGILNHTHTHDLVHMGGVLDAIGVDLTVVTGPIKSEHKNFRHFSDYEIDVDRFRTFIADWLHSAA